VPAGALWLVRYQVGVVYAFAALAKLHGDWLVHGLPLRLWLPARAERLPLVSDLLAGEGAARGLSLAGFAFDASVVALLSWRRTRPAAFVGVVAFHLVTWRLFAIGVFPWLMIGAATAFFAPDWPRRVGRWRPTGRPAPPAVALSAVALSAVALSAVAPAGGAPTGGAGAGRRLGPVALIAVVVWATAQLALPLRHWLLPGDARWTGEGYRLAWNVLAVEKAGTVEFRLRDPLTGVAWRDDARGLYTPEQWRVMATEPGLVHQAALELAAEARGAGHERVEVRADVWVAFNGRPAARLVDPEVDLAAQPRRLGHAPWVLPPPVAAAP
jgi:hypothetical protein